MASFTDLQAPGAVPADIWQQIQDTSKAYNEAQRAGDAQRAGHYVPTSQTFMGPDGVMYQATFGGGWQPQGEAGDVWVGDPYLAGVYAGDPNHYTNGDTYWQFDPNTGKFLNKGQFDSGKWSLGDVLDGVKFVGGAALGMNALTGLAGMGGAASGGATAGGLDSANGVLNSAVMNGSGDVADGGWGLLNQVVTQGPGTDLAGLAAAGTGATVIPSVASAAGGGLLSGLLPEGASKLLGPAAALLGAAAGSQGVKSSQSQTRDIPEWLKPSVNGLLGYTNQKLAADMAPGALAGYDQMKQLGQGLMAAPVAGNGFGLLTKGRY